MIRVIHALLLLTLTLVPLYGTFCQFGPRYLKNSLESVQFNRGSLDPDLISEIITDKQSTMLFELTFNEEVGFANEFARKLMRASFNNADEKVIAQNLMGISVEFAFPVSFIDWYLKYHGTKTDDGNYEFPRHLQDLIDEMTHLESTSSQDNNLSPYFFQQIQQPYITLENTRIYFHEILLEIALNACKSNQHLRNNGLYMEDSEIDISILQRVTASYDANQIIAFSNAYFRLQSIVTNELEILIRNSIVFTEIDAKSIEKKLNELGLTTGSVDEFSEQFLEAQRLEKQEKQLKKEIEFCYSSDSIDVARIPQLHRSLSQIIEEKSRVSEKVKSQNFLFNEEFLANRNKKLEKEIAENTYNLSAAISEFDDCNSELCQNFPRLRQSLLDRSQQPSDPFINQTLFKNLNDIDESELLFLSQAIYYPLSSLKLDLQEQILNEIIIELIIQMRKQGRVDFLSDFESIKKSLLVPIAILNNLDEILPFEYSFNAIQGLYHLMKSENNSLLIKSICKSMIQSFTISETQIAFDSEAYLLAMQGLKK